MFNKPPEFYTLKNILKHKAHYNLIVGERSNGKTYSVLELGLKNWCEYVTGKTDQKKKLAILRRYEESTKKGRAKTFFNNLVANGLVEKYSEGIYNTIVYDNGEYFLATINPENNEVIKQIEPFAHLFIVSQSEHYKMNSFPDITTILYDEFLTKKRELSDEFIQFMSILSTIIRLRDNVTIFMCGNTVNDYSCYFKEFGIQLQDLKQGVISVYRYGESDLKVCVELTENLMKNKPSNVYFAFDNPKLAMIRTGGWEFDIFPHLTQKYETKHIKFMYWVIFNDVILQCEIIKNKNQLFTYVHKKTTIIQNDKKDRIYCITENQQTNYHKDITRPKNELERFIYSFFIDCKVFYQNNSVGNTMANYLKNCKKTY